MTGTGTETGTRTRTGTRMGIGTGTGTRESGTGAENLAEVKDGGGKRKSGNLRCDSKGIIGNRGNRSNSKCNSGDSKGGIGDRSEKAREREGVTSTGNQRPQPQDTTLQ